MPKTNNLLNKTTVFILHFFNSAIKSAASPTETSVMITLDLNVHLQILSRQQTTNFPSMFLLHRLKKSSLLLFHIFTAVISLLKSYFIKKLKGK